MVNTHYNGGFRISPKGRQLPVGLHFIKSVDLCQNEGIGTLWGLGPHRLCSPGSANALSDRCP